MNIRHIRKVGIRNALVGERVLKSGEVAYYLKPDKATKWYRLYENRPWTDDIEFISAYKAIINKEATA